MRSAAAAQSVDTQGMGSIRVVSFPGTITSQFADAAREATRQGSPGGRYLLFYAAGYGDGRHTTMDFNSGEEAPTDLGAGMLSKLFTTFSLPARPCTLKDIQC